MSFAVGGVASALASATMLIAARFLVGAAIGVASYAVPLYISELAPPRWRGWLVSLNQLAPTLGMLLASVVDDAFASSGAWRWMLRLAVLPAVLLGLGVAFLPESSRWLVLHGQVSKGRAVLRRASGDQNVVLSQSASVRSSGSLSPRSTRCAWGVWR